MFFVLCVQKIQHIFCSLACSIELEDMVVVTGGCCAITRVMAYNNDGPMYRLPDMPTAREKHACSHYVDSNNNLVSHVNIEKTIFLDPVGSLVSTLLISGLLSHFCLNL